mgnify:CR=1 FL=1
MLLAYQPPEAPLPSSSAAATPYSTHDRRRPLDNVLTLSSLDRRPSCPSLFFSLRVSACSSFRLNHISLCSAAPQSSRFFATLKRTYASIPCRPRYLRQVIRVPLLLEPRPASPHRTVSSRVPVVYQPLTEVTSARACCSGGLLSLRLSRSSSSGIGSNTNWSLFIFFSCLRCFHTQTLKITTFGYQHGFSSAVPLNSSLFDSSALIQ